MIASLTLYTLGRESAPLTLSRRASSPEHLLFCLYTVAKGSAPHMLRKEVVSVVLRHKEVSQQFTMETEGETLLCAAVLVTGGLLLALEVFNQPDAGFDDNELDTKTR